MENKQVQDGAVEVYLPIDDEDIDVQEILSRTVGKKNDFVKEAIFYWYFILKHSNLKTRSIHLTNEEKTIIEGLFPNEYIENRFSPTQVKHDTKYKDVIIRFTVKKEDSELIYILERASNIKAFVREAIIEWDCLLNHSNLFISRFIKKRTDTNKVWPKFEKSINYNETPISNIPINASTNVNIEKVFNTEENKNTNNYQDSAVQKQTISSNLSNANVSRENVEVAPNSSTNLDSQILMNTIVQPTNMPSNTNTTTDAPKKPKIGKTNKLQF